MIVTMVWKRVLAVLVLGILHYGTCQQPTLTITPRKSELLLSYEEAKGSEGKEVTIKCDGAAFNDPVVAISIQRKLYTSPNTDPKAIVNAVAGSDDSPKFDNVNAPSSLQSSSSLTGSVGEKQVTLTMRKAMCSDTGTYVCGVSVYGNGGTTTPTSSAELEVGVLPGNMSKVGATNDPSRLGNRWVNDTVTLLCNGPVGSVYNTTRAEVIWQHKDEGSFQQWENYNSVSDVSQLNVVNEPSMCSKRYYSQLKRTITMDDSDRTYRCLVRRDGRDYDEFASSYSIGMVDPIGGDPNTNTGGSGDGGTPPTKADSAGAIAGGVIGGLLVIVVIIVIIVVVMRRKKQKGDNYGTDENEKPADEAAPPYTVDPPAVTYTQPNRFRGDKPRSHSNKAMEEDEKPEKPVSGGDKYYNGPRDYESKPARYENDFRQGRRNQAYDDDHRGPRNRSYNSDDGGTDSQFNTSRTSLGDGNPNIGTAI